MVNLSKAPLFSLLTAEQLASVKQACVFGGSANEAIYVTHSNEVSGRENGQFEVVDEIKLSCGKVLQIHQTTVNYLFTFLLYYRTEKQIASFWKNVKLLIFNQSLLLRKQNVSSGFVIFVNVFSQVFALGMNCNGCLGTGDGLNTIVPKKLDTFNGKKIVSLSHGRGPHILLATDGTSDLTSAVSPRFVHERNMATKPGHQN